jgi:steroid 5-alpha reductase family enzyme
MPPLLAALVAALALMTLVWLASLRARDVSLVDRWWGPGFAVAAWTWVLTQGAFTPRALAIAALVTIWGARLGWHITRRNRGHGEDPRYAAMRARAPRSFAWTSLVTVFALQAVILWVVALPLWAATRPDAPASPRPLDALALALWLVGLTFEAVGDAQLAAFKRDPANRGRVMDRGLWAWTRHPNYFGDATLWWGLGLFALATPGAWWTLIGPLLMTTLLVRVSGVALLERAMATRPGYAEYVARTSSFLPRPPRRG